MCGGIACWLLAAMLTPLGAWAAEPETAATDASVLTAAFERGYAGGPATAPAPALTVARQGRSATLIGRRGDAQVELVCLLCDDAELVATAREAGARLAAAAGGAPPARLVVAGLDPGDRVLLDGFPGGLPEPVIEPGVHRIVVERGDERRAESLTLSPGERARLEFGDLERAPRPGVARRTAIVLGGLGVAAAAVGTTLLVLHDDCASARVDRSGNCAELHDTGPLGWSFLGAGAASLTAGLVVLLIDRITRDEELPPPEDDR